MRTRLTTLLLAATLAAAVAVGSPPPAAAQESGGPCAVCGNNGPAATDDGFLSSVGSAIHQLNNGGSTSGGPPPCSEEDLTTPPGPGEDQPGPTHVGHYGYAPPLLGQEFHNEITNTSSPGTWWRLECVFEDGYQPPISQLVRLVFFPEITGANLARWAVDQALTRVPAPQPRMSPDNGEQLVNLTTYLWVDGIPDTSFPGETVSVPGITVTVEVSTGGVYWVMGDGTELSCGVGSPDSPECSHTYRRSSASEADQSFHGSASVRWTARYWVNGAGPYEVTDAVVRTTPFSVRVGEGQAIVTG
jgi:hypothetical protein